MGARCAETILEMIGKPLDDQFRIEGGLLHLCGPGEAANLLQLFYDKADPGRVGEHAYPLRNPGAATAAESE